MKKVEKGLITIDVPTEVKEHICNELNKLYSDDRMDYVLLTPLADEILENCKGTYPTQYYKNFFVSINILLPILINTEEFFIVQTLGIKRIFPDIIKHETPLSEEEMIEKHILLSGIHWMINGKLKKAFNDLNFDLKKKDGTIINYKINVKNLNYFKLLPLEIFNNSERVKERFLVIDKSNG